MLGLGSSVVNLTQDFPLTYHEQNILAKGLNFIPTPKFIQKSKLDDSVSKLKRGIRLNWFFRKHSTIQKKQRFMGKSNWIPPDKEIPKEILDFETEIGDIVKNSIPRSDKQNLSKTENHALKSLKNAQDIVFKPADKGSATVVMHKSEYVNEAMRQLNDSKYYIKVVDSVRNNTSKKINEILLDLKNKKILKPRQFNHLKPPENARARQFYLLPKIHKPMNKWPCPGLMPPGRPIVSNCGSETYEIAKYITWAIQIYSDWHPTYIKNTTDFLAKIKNIEVPKNALLFTMDVSSLYTNIDTEMGLKAIRDIWRRDDDRPSQILDLLELCLKNNYFQFNGETYLQVKGTSMGASFAPPYADIFMAKFEKEALKKCDKKPLKLLRYLDDYFGIWQHSEQEFQQFFDTFNSHYESIKLTSVLSTESVDFLDTTVYKGNQFRVNSKLDTKVFFKDTDTHQLLHKQSFHPKHVFSGILKSQITRFHRICNNKNDFEEACTTLFSALRKRNYSKRFLRSVKSKTVKSLENHETKFERCNKPRCIVCQYAPSEVRTFESDLEDTFQIDQNLSCDTKDIVYIIKCNTCTRNGIYVGETSLSLGKRLSQHLYTIRQKHSTPVADHFSRNGHDYERDLAIFPIAKTYGAPNRKRAEAQWIMKLRTGGFMGLNRQYPDPSKFVIPFVIPFSNTSNDIINQVNATFDELQQSLPTPFANVKLMSAYERNKNIKDTLIHTKLI